MFVFSVIATVSILYPQLAVQWKCHQKTNSHPWLIATSLLKSLSTSCPTVTLTFLCFSDMSDCFCLKPHVVNSYAKRR